MTVFRSNSFPQGTRFVCPVCQRKFISGNQNVQGLAVHPPGTCCHYTDKEVTE